MKPKLDTYFLQSRVLTTEFIQGKLCNLIPKVEFKMIFESLVPPELFQVIWNHVTIYRVEH